MLKKKIEELKKEILTQLQSIGTAEELVIFETRMMGRKGTMTDALKGIAELPPEERRALGPVINEVRTALIEAFEQRKVMVTPKGGSEQSIDTTLPGKQLPVGHLHPVTYAIEEIEEIFMRLGFVRARYPEVEWDYFAFETLNMPADHPARDEWETFFISEKPVSDNGRMLLTPHTSSGQVREMRKYSPKGLPVRMLNIAKTYRRQIDISHTPMFHQFEGLVVDRTVTITQLMGILDYFVKEFFGAQRKVRIRPFHFRFTEPSFEVDISCGLCDAKGCTYCKQGWTELGGAGMVHPNVLRAGGYDPHEFTGCAFGFGVERTYLMKSNLNIGDLRQVYSNDVRFLEQF